MEKSLVVLWIVIFFLIFYGGSVNVGIWGKWQGLEIVMPIIISFFLSTVIIILIYIVKEFLKHKK